MCGIHLIWGKGANQEAIQSLVTSSIHRGPDQQAVYSPWLGLWIGVTRLKILHPGPDADMPFWAPDNKSLLIWNGEIYNFLELRSLLTKMGVEFSTQSDTEVLLHYLKFFGAEGLAKLNGMFSLIYVDLIQKSVLIARDRNGEKPLYFSQNPDTLIISSESRGIARLTKADVDLQQADSYYYFRSPSPGKTFFKGIRTWKPSRYSTIFQHTAFRWDTIPLPKKPSKVPTNEDLKNLLSEIVMQQFHADVQVGMMLSGGCDSSLLYGTWYQNTGTPLPAFTVEVEKKYQKKYADASAAKRLIQHYPANLDLIPIDQTIFLDHWDEYLQSVDIPIGDSAGFLTWILGKKAKTQAKVLISGAGADELWGGYRRHSAFQHYLEHPKIWASWAPFLSKLPFGIAWKKLMVGIDSDPDRTFLNFSALENPPSELMDEYSRIFNSKLPEYKRVLDFDRQVYLVQDVLKIQDNALMAHGVEGRSPYLDARMLANWKAIDDPVRLVGKPWIKNSLEEIGLNWVAERKKFGFGLPLQEWLSEKGPVSKKIFSTLKEFASQNPTLTPHLLEICKNPEDAAKTHFLTLYNLFLLAEWTNLHKQ